MQPLDTLVIGGGQAGLAISYYLTQIDRFIEKQSLSAPEDELPELRDGYQAPVLTELVLDDAGISTIIWATGYSFDLSRVKFPVFAEFGYPVQERGVTAQPGLYFVGLHWLHTIRSGLLGGGRRRRGPRGRAYASRA